MHGQQCVSTTAAGLRRNPGGHVAARARWICRDAVHRAVSNERVCYADDGVRRWDCGGTGAVDVVSKTGWRG